MNNTVNSCITRILFLLYCIGIIFSLIACNSSETKRLEQALVVAADNRVELEKVLNHYKNDPEKLAAARFLIMNMRGHSGVNKSDIEKLQPTYSKYVTISEKYDWKFSSKWKRD